MAHIIAADEKIDPKELNYFIWLMNNFGIDAHHRAILQDDLKGRGRIDEIHKDITNPRDRQALINWARIVMNVDGVVDPREKEMFDQLVKLNEEASRTTSSEYVELGKSILQLEKENQLWAELAEAGSMLNQRAPMWAWIAPRYVGSLMFGRILASGNRFAIGMLVLGVLAMIFILIMASLKSH